MRLFRWLSEERIPAAFDLRQRGWQLAGKHTPMDCVRHCPALALTDCLEGVPRERLADPTSFPPRSQLLLLDVDDEDERAQFLRQGFGDVLGGRTSLAEIEARAERIATTAAALPRSRAVGPLRLDLFARDGFVGERPLGLHPREFALIWRLADTPGVPVGKAELVTEVWRMAHVPETNSIAVHVFRLRAKLAVAGVHDLVQTAKSGGYFLALSDPPVAPESRTSISDEE